MASRHFGHIEGIKVGECFESREDLARVGIHAPLMSGIWGAQEGACSIVLSGGYEDDKDYLNYILYTGQGGQDAPGGRQVADQEFTRGNRGLQLSYQYHLPVRVIRGHQIKNGPRTGYRYDGLYDVRRCERVKGKSNFYICRFHLVSEASIDELESKLSLKPSYERSPRVQRTVSMLKRNVKLSEDIKSMYDHKCQICSIKLKSPLAHSGAIANAAHIKRLGQPDHGPDVLGNILCLCPNHHAQFDSFSYYIEPNTLKVKGLEGFEGKTIVCRRKHRIKREFLEHQKLKYIDNN